MQPIEADFENTWPEGLLRELEASQDTLAAFQLERARIDRAACDDVMLREYRPENPHQAAWDAALSLAKHATASGHLLGFHATRLMDHEVEEIKRRGLQLCSIELLQHRLVAAQQLGKLASGQVTRLIEDHHATEDNRSGRTAFFFTRAQLNDAGLDRLWGFWGGEALYSRHENDPDTGPVLRSLGSACIVCGRIEG